MYNACSVNERLVMICPENFQTFICVIVWILEFNINLILQPPERRMTKTSQTSGKTKCMTFETPVERLRASCVVPVAAEEEKMSKIKKYLYDKYGEDADLSEFGKEVEDDATETK